MTTGLADRTEETIKLAAQKLYEERAKVRKAAGKRPFMGKEADSNVALGEYMRIRRDPQAWVEALQDSVRIKEDGRVLVPNELVESVREFERKLAPPPIVSDMGLEGIEE